MTNNEFQTSHHNSLVWSAALRAAMGNMSGKMARICGEFSKTKADYVEQFSALQLPTYVRTIEPLESSLQEGVNAEGITTERCWFQLMPNNPHDTKVTVLDVAKDDALNSVIASINQHDINPVDYQLLVSEFLENRYGGQMVVSEMGMVSIYFGEGNEADYSTGNKVPQYTADNNRPTNTFHYSFEDTELRRSVQKLVEAITLKGGDSMRPGYHPGYYEFALCGDELKPIFLDYRPSDIYQLPDNTFS
ncbi:MAG TPA: hypothetical protein PKD19_03855 [Candidatus Saccharibacteria bacterium]|nr:hypothetical protein [Candidatus Saccharibacteria bacterium]